MNTPSEASTATLNELAPELREAFAGNSPGLSTMVLVSPDYRLAPELAIHARDRGDPRLCFQLLLYPMLDPSHDTASGHEVTNPRFWNREVPLRVVPGVSHRAEWAASHVPVWESFQQGYLAALKRALSEPAATGRGA